MDEYYDELLYEIGGGDGYFRLLDKLYEMKFLPDLGTLDYARAMDVYSILRVPYGAREDDKNVSVLEMIIALCIRVGHSVIGDDDTEKYFWDFMRNLGLTEEEDRNFDEEIVENVISKWLKKEYKKNGIGSPWPVKNYPEIDCREIDIWRHCNLYLTEKYL